jgi:predicted aspartyl protease
MGFTRNRFGGLTLAVTILATVAGFSYQPRCAFSQAPAAVIAPALPAAAMAPLRFDLLDQHLIVVRGSIGPLDGLKLLIDTGSNPTMVDRRVAKKLALAVQGGKIIAFGQESDSLTAVLPGIRLGPRNAGAIPAAVGDLSYLHGVDAVIGLDVLSRSSFSIDYEKRAIVFGPMAERQPSVLLEVTPPFLTVQLAICGRPVRLLVDTGSRRLVLFERRVQDRLPPLSQHGELLMYHFSGMSRLNRVFLTPVEIGTATFNRVEGFISDTRLDGYPSGIDGVLGLRALASKRVDFDFERGRLAFDQ